MVINHVTFFDTYLLLKTSYIIKSWNVHHRSSIKKGTYILNETTRACFIKVKKRRTDKTILNSEFADESYFTIDIFLLISLFNLLLISLSASNDGLKP